MKNKYPKDIYFEIRNIFLWNLFLHCLCEDDENIFIDKIIEYLQKLDLSYDVNKITKSQLKYIDIWWL